MSAEFIPWPKIARLKRGLGVTVTDKIDGTNGCLIVAGGQLVGVQSRNKLITPEDDNYGLAGWAHDNRATICQLGDGHHYGEWAGPGIQKNPHGIAEKRFFLFNSHRWTETPPPAPLGVVPVLYVGEYDRAAIDALLVGRAEGVVIYFHDFRAYLKLTLKNPDGKWVQP